MSFPNFGDKEYLTFLFPNENEEHLVPKDLFEESQSLHLKTNFENTVVTEIASEVFADLTDFLAKDHSKIDYEHVDQMIDAAKELGLTQTAKKLAKLWKPI